VNIAIFGTGYVGLVTGTCFAEMGNHVTCIDVNPTVVSRLNEGVLPIFEPGLEEMVIRNHRAGRLTFTIDAQRGIDQGEVIFIAVGTPPSEDGSADLSHVKAVARSIGQQMKSPKIVVCKSTVPVGTGDIIRATIAEILVQRGVDIEFDVASNPEFLKEGAAVGDFMKPDRIVIGSSNPATIETLRALYTPYNRNRDKVIVMDVRSAELTKYAANAMLATRISLMNEIANLAERLGADIEAVRRGIGTDPRIGFNFLYAGAGYGGSCFPKDVKALVSMAESLGFEAAVMQGVETINERQKQVLYSKIERHFKGKLQGMKFALWGLSFKPNTDDLREAPSLVVINQLLKAGAVVRAYDPEARTKARQHFQSVPGIEIFDRRDDVLEDADALVIVTEWNEFRSPDFRMLKSKLRTRTIFDGRNLFEPAVMQELGIAYFGIGRGLRPGATDSA